MPSDKDTDCPMVEATAEFLLHRLERCSTVIPDFERDAIYHEFKRRDRVRVAAEACADAWAAAHTERFVVWRFPGLTELDELAGEHQFSVGKATAALDAARRGEA